MVKKLIDLGLTPKEAEVYLVLLKSGDSTADQLAKLAKLNRSTAYVQIKQLVEFGLVSTFKRGKKTFFAAESPTNLIRILENKHQQIEAQKNEVVLLVPELLKLYGSSIDRPAVRVFEGKEGLVSMRNSILEANPKIMQVAFSFDAMSKIFNTEEMMSFSLKRAKRNIYTQGLYTKTGDDVLVVPPQQLKRISLEEYPFGADVYVYGDTVSLASTKDQIVGITITNADIAKTVKTLFDIAWNTTQPYK